MYARTMDITPRSTGLHVKSQRDTAEHTVSA